MNKYLVLDPKPSDLTMIRVIKARAENSCNTGEIIISQGTFLCHGDIFMSWELFRSCVRV